MTGNRGPGTSQTGAPFPLGAALPGDYLKNGYFDASGHPLPAIIVDWPKQIALTLHSTRQLNTAQLRRFFAEIRRIEARLDAGTPFDALRAELLRLDGYATSAVQKKKAPPLFSTFITQNLRWAAKDEKAFRKGFVPHFEAVVAYFPETR